MISSQKLAHILTLIALQLHDLAVLRMLDDRAVARKLPLEGLDKFLLVERLAYALHSSQCLTAIALLYAYVYEAAASTKVKLLGVEIVKFVQARRIFEWIYLK
jgi:hypothetical protein